MYNMQPPYGPAAAERLNGPWIPGPGSVLWERGGDVRLMFVAGRSVLLQVAHPTIAAGVAQHSDYANDPWKRLRGTLNLYVAGVNFGWPDGQEAAAKRLRRMHSGIGGLDFEGRHYHALDPEPFAWVHATLVDGFMLMLERYFPSIAGCELDAAYAEMRALGSLYGVADELMPADRSAHRDYFDLTVETTLTDNEVFREVLGQVGRPPAPRALRNAEPLWRAAAALPGRASRLAGVGLLPPRLRERFGLPWSAADARALERQAALARRLAPLLPERLRLLPSVYSAKRRELSRPSSIVQPA